MKHFAIVLLLATLAVAALPAQTTAKAANKVAAPVVSPAPESGHEMNIRAYIELLRIDVKKQKAQIMSNVMQLDADQAVAFWPVYKEFETEFSKTGDQVVELVKNYAANYSNTWSTTLIPVFTGQYF